MTGAQLIITMVHKEYYDAMEKLFIIIWLFCLLLVVTIADDHWVTIQDLNSWVPAFFWLIKDDIAILMVYCFQEST